MTTKGVYLNLNTPKTYKTQTPPRFFHTEEMSFWRHLVHVTTQHVKTGFRRLEPKEPQAVVPVQKYWVIPNRTRGCGRANQRYWVIPNRTRGTGFYQTEPEAVSERTRGTGLYQTEPEVLGYTKQNQRDLVLPNRPTGCFTKGSCNSKTKQCDSWSENETIRALVLRDHRLFSSLAILCTVTNPIPHGGALDNSP